ncbi:hypothetical protein CDV36_014295 [Fusarium kuroshium]|uniref:Uncharacterized protein n=1 Tax=Fusarium kuroshium TaxID=2010991 RepID=A0A3M2RIG7_9HYPO|nr:hypothetical protein CDV36_014295 [Fusarium kuroshium]
MSLKIPIRALPRIAPRHRLCGTIDRLGVAGLSCRNFPSSRPSIYSSPCSSIFTVEHRMFTTIIRHSTMATEDVNIAKALEKVQIDEAKDVQEDSDPEDILEKWQPLVDAIAAATKEAFPASPAFDPSSPSTFQTYWRGVFTNLRDSVVKDEKISHYITKPPVNTCNITLFDNRDVMGCPCCQSPSEPAIELKNENGVTKEDFMNAVMDILYGETLPKVFVEAYPMHDEEDNETDDNDVESEDGSEDDAPEAMGFENYSGVLMYTYGWMSGCDNDEGERVMYGDEPDVILYCCRPDEFEKKAKSVEKKMKDWKDSKDSKDAKASKEVRESKL